MAQNTRLGGKKLVFIVGASRSGTTWLQLLLFHTGLIATAQETHLFSHYMSNLWSAWHKHAGRRESPDMRQIGLPGLVDEEVYFAACRQFAAEMLGAIGDRFPNRPIVLEKTPQHLNVAPFIRRLFPHARFIHLVRDPRAVVNSTVFAREWATGWADNKVGQQVETWKRAVVAGHDLCAKNPFGREIRYEDLLADTAGQLGGICRWLGLSVPDAALAAAVEACRIETLRAAVAAQPADSSASQEPWSLASEPEGFYRRGEAEAWRTEMPLADIALIEEMAAEEMAQFGYLPRITLRAGPALGASAGTRAKRAAVAKWLRAKATREAAAKTAAPVDEAGEKPSETEI